MIIERFRIDKEWYQGPNHATVHRATKLGRPLRLLGLSVNPRVTVLAGGIPVGFRRASREGRLPASRGP